MDTELMRSVRMRWNMIKNKILTTRTSEDLYHRFKKLCDKKAWRGDDWLVMFLSKFEDEQDFLRSQVDLEMGKLRMINKELVDLENQRISCENLIQELSANLVDSDGDVDDPINKAANIVLQRYNMQSIFDLESFIEMNQELMMMQSYLAGCSLEDLERRIIEKA